jgi:prephenate dehydrogenase
MIKEVKKITIVGVGLIGGSFGLALKRVRPDITVCGIDIDENILIKGKKNGVIDCYTLSIKDGVKDADIIIIASSINKIIKIAEEIIPFMKSGSIITDVGSVKGTIVSTIEKMLPEDKYYVPGHPMAGSEKKGIEGADTYLFENAAYILTPTPNTNKQALEIIKKLISDLGARPLIMGPKEHDLQVAAVSHLPHIIAASLVNSIGGLKEKFPQLLLLAAGGFRDTTRIASSQPEMWKDICLCNKEAILQVIGNYEKKLNIFKRAILEENIDLLLELFSQARNLREQVPAGIKGILPELYEIVVAVPDRPGMIGQLAQILGENNINIIDIEILRVREGHGGTIRLGFLEKIAAAKAVEILQKEHFKVYPKF